MSMVFLYVTRFAKGWFCFVDSMNGFVIFDAVLENCDSKMILSRF